MKTPNVIVSTGRGRSHLYNAARAAQRAGYLHSMITSFYIREHWLRWAYRLEQLGLKHFGRLRLRYDAELDSDRVIALAGPEIMNMVATYLTRWWPGTKQHVDWAVSRLYGRLAARHIETSCNLVHARSGFSREIIPKAHSIGAKVLLEQPTAHPLFVQNILKGEHDRCGTPPNRRRYLRFADEQKWDMAHTDYLLSSSDFAAETMVQYGIDPKRIRVVYLGVDTMLFKPYPQYESKKFRILCVASISVLKGIHYLLEAYQRLSLPDAELMLVGGVGLDAPPTVLRQRDQFEHFSYVPQYELPQIYSSASVFVLPSLCEGSALVIAEAMACSVPVVVTRNTGTFARDGVDGYVVPAQDADALAERILRLYEDPSLREEMGRSARKRVEESFTWDHYGRQLLKVYEEIVNVNG